MNEDTVKNYEYAKKLWNDEQNANDGNTYKLLCVCHDCDVSEEMTSALGAMVFFNKHQMHKTSMR